MWKKMCIIYVDFDWTRYLELYTQSTSATTELLYKYMWSFMHWKFRSIGKEAAK